MSDKYVIDANAWIEYLKGSDAGRKIRSAIEEGEVYTCAVTVAEVISKVAREEGDVEAAHNILTSNSTILDADEEISKEAGILHARMRKDVPDFGLADAYILASAKKTASKVLTGDIHFKGVKEAIFIRS